MQIPSIVIAGTNSGCGKTTISMGIMAALSVKGYKVQPFKVGPDYIDPMFHTFITGRESRNLDSWILSNDIVKQLFLNNSEDADIAVVEGVMGLYDGYGGSSLVGSTADVARIIGAPVVLVVNCEAMSLSAAALVKGFAEFDKNVCVKGVIINNIYSEGHYKLLKTAIENHTGVAVLGYLKQSEELSIGSRHLGLVTSSEIDGLTEKVEKLSQQVQKTIDLELLVKLASEAGGSNYNDKFELNSVEVWDRKIQNCPLPQEQVGEKELNYPLPEEQTGEKVQNCPLPGIRLGVAMDKAFCFYYKDNLELLESLGAQLVYFSPLKDEELPLDIDGLYMGGGYPEVWAKELQENTSMRRDIKAMIVKGLPVYAECGGLMYLTESISDMEGNTFEMVGAIPGKSSMTSSLKRFGYVYVKIIEDNILSRKDDEIRAHEFHYSQTKVDDGVQACFDVSKSKDGSDIKQWSCGFKIYNVLAGYQHLHFWGNLDFAVRFIDSCRKYKEDGGLNHG